MTLVIIRCIVRTNELSTIDNFNVRTVSNLDGLVHLHVHFPTLAKVGHRVFRIHVPIVGGGEFDLANVLFQQLCVFVCDEI